MLQIHNSLSRQLEVFRPIDIRNIRMYVCGMTVYDFCHIGHARVLVVFDVVYRYLRHIYGAEHVTYVRNITDIDDKIIKRANEQGEHIDAVTSRYIEAMNEDAAALGVLTPNQEPRATQHMQHIIDMIASLVEKRYAYQANNGDVYYDVSEFSPYGQLSGRQVDDLRAGARVEVDEAKSDPLDFVLWKSAKPGEPQWDSPWGPGRPGWHIECSAMATHCLGNHFDIHGGGMDLQFPHHENEIAQSCGATGDQFVNLWMHNGFVRIDNEKMSKSLGNFFTIREVLEKYDPEVIRYFILSSHYRSPLNYSDQHLDTAKNALTTLYTALRGIEPAKKFESTEYTTRFIQAMDNDFATPEAQSVLFDIAHEINRLRDTDQVQAALLAAEMVMLASMLGLLQRSPNTYFQADVADGLSSDEIEALINQRNTARANKDFATADRIRQELTDMAVVLEDGPNGTTWRRE